MAPKYLPPELLFELVPLFPVEETLPNVFLSCRLLHNFLLPRVDKWKEKMESRIDQLEKEVRELRTFQRDAIHQLDSTVTTAEFGNQEVARLCRNTAHYCQQIIRSCREINRTSEHAVKTMELVSLNISAGVSAFKNQTQHKMDTDSPTTVERTFSGGQRTAAAPSAAALAARGAELGAVTSANKNNFGDYVLSTTSPICPNDKVSLSIAIRQGRLDNPSVDSAIKSNCEKSDKALFYEHAESLQSLLHDFPRKLRNECTDKSINIAIYGFEARFMSTLDEMNSVMNGLRSSIDAEEATKLKQIIEHLMKWAANVRERAENLSKFSSIGPLFTPLSGIKQHSASELRGKLPRGTDANAQQRELQRQPAKSFELFETAPERKESAEKGQTKQGKEFAAAGLTNSNESNSLFAPLSGIKQHSASELRGQLPRGTDANVQPKAPQPQHEKAKSGKTPEAASKRKESAEKGQTKQGKEVVAAGLTPTDELDITASTSTPPFLRNLSFVYRMPKLVRSLTKEPIPGITKLSNFNDIKNFWIQSCKTQLCKNND